MGPRAIRVEVMSPAAMSSAAITTLRVGSPVWPILASEAMVAAANAIKVASRYQAHQQVACIAEVKQGEHDERGDGRDLPSVCL